MEKLRLLKVMIDIFYLIILAVLLFATFGIPIMLYAGADIPIKIDGNDVSMQWPNIYFSIMVLFYWGFAYAVNLLRKVIRLFIQKELFSDSVVNYFYRIGICIISVSITESIMRFFYNASVHNKIELIVETDLDSLIGLLIVGLFFLVLSEVFKIAKDLKEENELTI